MSDNILHTQTLYFRHSRHCKRTSHWASDDGVGDAQTLHGTLETLHCSSSFSSWNPAYATMFIWLIACPYNNTIQTTFFRFYRKSSIFHISVVLDQISIKFYPVLFLDTNTPHPKAESSKTPCQIGLKCKWHEKFYCPLWKSFKNLKDCRLPFLNIVSSSRVINV